MDQKTSRPEARALLDTSVDESTAIDLRGAGLRVELPPPRPSQPPLPPRPTSVSPRPRPKRSTNKYSGSATEPISATSTSTERPPAVPPRPPRAKPPTPLSSSSSAPTSSSSPSQNLLVFSPDQKLAQTTSPFKFEDFDPLFSTGARPKTKPNESSTQPPALKAKTSLAFEHKALSSSLELHQLNTPSAITSSSSQPNLGAYTTRHRHASGPNARPGENAATNGRGEGATLAPSVPPGRNTASCSSRRASDLIAFDYSAASNTASSAGSKIPAQRMWSSDDMQEFDPLSSVSSVTSRSSRQPTVCSVPDVEINGGLGSNGAKMSDEFEDIDNDEEHLDEIQDPFSVASLTLLAQCRKPPVPPRQPLAQAIKMAPDMTSRSLTIHQHKTNDERTKTSPTSNTPVITKVRLKN